MIPASVALKTAHMNNAEELHKLSGKELLLVAALVDIPKRGHVPISYWSVLVLGIGNMKWV